MTPLHWAVEKEFDNIAELLIENGANSHIQSKFLKTPYSIAKEKNNDYIVNLIESLPTSPNTPSLSSAFDSSVFIKTPTSKNAPKESQCLKDEPSSIEMPSKRARFHSYDAGADSKRLRSANDAKNLTLQLLQEQMNMMSSADDNLIQSALQSGRKIMLSEAGKRLLNDSNLNKFLKIPLNTTISSSPSTSNSKTLISPRSTTTNALQRRTSDSSDILEIFHDGKKSNNDILNFIRSSGSDLQVRIIKFYSTFRFIKIFCSFIGSNNNTSIIVLIIIEAIDTCIIAHTKINRNQPFCHYSAKSESSKYRC